MQNRNMWVTDLDGTLLDGQEKLPSQMLDIIPNINENTIKVIATGRNLEKVWKVIDNPKLFNYIIFSSGAGIYNCISGKIIQVNNLRQEDSIEIFNYLDKQSQNFIYTKEVPQNSTLYYKQNYSCDHFTEYVDAHQEELENTLNPFSDKLAQFMAFLPNQKNQIEIHTSRIMEISKNIQVIRATSPIDKDFCWLEIFHQNVSKGKAVQFLSNTLSIDLKDIIGVGNDYNDLDFLEIIGKPYVVDNSPQKIKANFPVVSSNNELGVLEVLKKHNLA
ncbi:Cof-type HAD-IIB family hydrolase [Halosquirtibacter laminarini]|uniref:Cof-type HAD-IIB family hydrolase n=1 Tax=Halosquirtibacter laminarini TaxID=3374600 RepID=A0AC61NFH0_9BACT|nr:Cof-type HAD-IIB family hydrolase [Prolixibacteraceae bacterium]